jgi:uncharacterized protein (UPF0276 family)
MISLGLGIGWRPELALDIERRADLGFVEIVAENIDPSSPPDALMRLRERGLAIIPHGISLSLGGAEPIEPARVKRLADLAKLFESPIVSEHIAFVRAGGREAGHLLPIPRTKVAVDAIVDNIRRAQDLLAVPIALENIAALFEWPAAEMPEAAFVTEILDRTDALLLLDVANVWANRPNHSTTNDIALNFDGLPLQRLAYVHVAGGEFQADGYHDTHRAHVPAEVFNLLDSLMQTAHAPGVMLERDGDYPSAAELKLELDAIAAVLQRHANSEKHRHDRGIPGPTSKAAGGADPRTAGQR